MMTNDDGFKIDYDRLKAAAPVLMWYEERKLAISERWWQLRNWLRGLAE
jgi:hypothetical protein